MLTSAYFVLVCACHLLAGLSARVARNGPPRPILHSRLSEDEDEDEYEDEEEGRRRDDDDDGAEVVVITGGGRGLGQCVAEIYGIKGANVAVLDLEVEKGEGEREGVWRYKCDVGNRAEVERVWARVVADVSLSFSWHNLALGFGGQTDPDWSIEWLTFGSPLDCSWGHRQF